MSRSQRQPKSDPDVTATDAAGIGGRIRRLRGAQSQLEFARRLGISREQLSRIESGAQVPSTGTLRRLALVTRESLDSVLLGEAAAELRVSPDAGGWVAALEPLLGGTALRLPRAATPAGRRAERAWRALSEERREEVRTLVRRVAALAVVVDALLPGKAGRGVTAELAAALPTLVIDRILT